MNPTDLVDQASLREDIPDFGPGDTVKVHVNIVEGTRSRIQVFQGVVIARSGHGVTGAEVRNIRPKRRLVNEIEGLHEVSSLRRHRSHANISKEVEL